mmetsp:Transcript_26288/g.65358  ORF Transcript_26288/g.65358 Transcript_26288/m.65358 type:complete len:83 (-) Transcript_26288:662-910(-)
MPLRRRCCGTQEGDDVATHDDVNDDRHPHRKTHTRERETARDGPTDERTRSSQTDIHAYKRTSIHTNERITTLMDSQIDTHE